MLLTPLECAHALGLGRSKVYELLSKGELESIRIGTARRIPVSAIETFIEGLRRGQNGA